jgi:hypothetical protein
MQTAQLVGVGPFGLGVADEVLTDMAESLYEEDATETQIADSMVTLSTKDRQTLGAKLIAYGVDPTRVRQALAMVGERLPFWLDPEKRKVGITVWGVLGTISMAASAYHGYARNKSIGWALWWGLMGSLFPVITPTIALAQCKSGPENRFKLGCRK